MNKQSTKAITESMQTAFQSPIALRQRKRAEQNALTTEYSSGCDIPAILLSMQSDQREHQFKTLTPAYLEFRNIVAEWILDLGEYFDLHPTTAHSAVCFLDRIQPNENFCRFQWQMVAISCVVIASKYNECEEHVPHMRSFMEIIEQDIPTKVSLEYELWVLKQMGWKLNARTPIAFLNCYRCVGITFDDDICSGVLETNYQHLESILFKHASLLCTMALLDVRFKIFPASVLSAAILYLSRKSIGILPYWRLELTSLTGHEPSQFSSILEMLQSASVEIKSQPSIQVTPIKTDKANSSQLSPHALDKNSKKEKSPNSIADAVSSPVCDAVSRMAELSI